MTESLGGVVFPSTATNNNPSSLKTSVSIRGERSNATLFTITKAKATNMAQRNDSLMHKDTINPLDTYSNSQTESFTKLEGHRHSEVPNALEFTDVSDALMNFPATPQTAVSGCNPSLNDAMDGFNATLPTHIGDDTALAPPYDTVIPYNQSSKHFSTYPIVSDQENPIGDYTEAACSDYAEVASQSPDGSRHACNNFIAVDHAPVRRQVPAPVSSTSNLLGNPLCNEKVFPGYGFPSSTFNDTFAIVPYTGRAKVSQFVDPHDSLMTQLDGTNVSNDPIPLDDKPNSHYFSETKFEKAGYVGLSNQGATCYMNSLLQALFMTPNFRKSLFNWRYDQDIDPSQEDCIPYQLQKLFGILQISDIPYADTKDLTKSFQWDLSDSFQQHDIEEFNKMLFDAIEKSCCTKDNQFINDQFFGEVIDFVQCKVCRRISVREQPFADLKLTVRDEFQGVANDSLEKALQNYLYVETLEGDNQYACEQCGVKRDAFKGTRISKLPPTLTIQIKRFIFDYITISRIKVNDRISFPSVLDMNNFVGGCDASVADAVVPPNSSGIHERDALHPSTSLSEFHNTLVNPILNTVDPFRSPILTPPKYPNYFEDGRQCYSEPMKLYSKQHLEKDAVWSNCTIKDPQRDYTLDAVAMAEDPAFHTVPLDRFAYSDPPTGREETEGFQVEMFPGGDDEGEDLLYGNSKHRQILPQDLDRPFSRYRRASQLPNSKGANLQQKDGSEEASFLDDAWIYNKILEYSKNGPLVYELYAILVHAGSALGGHYFAYIKNLASRKWYCFNDSVVMPIQSGEIMSTFGDDMRHPYSSANAYLLMYKQVQLSEGVPQTVAFPLDEDVPAYIVEVVNAMKVIEKEEAERLKKKEKEMEVVIIRRLSKNKAAAYAKYVGGTVKPFSNGFPGEEEMDAEPKSSPSSHRRRIITKGNGQSAYQSVQAFSEYVDLVEEGEDAYDLVAVTVTLPMKRTNTCAELHAAVYDTFRLEEEGVKPTDFRLRYSNGVWNTHRIPGRPIVMCDSAECLVEAENPVFSLFQYPNYEDDEVSPSLEEMEGHSSLYSRTPYEAVEANDGISVAPAEVFLRDSPIVATPSIRVPIDSMVTEGKPPVTNDYNTIKSRVAIETSERLSDFESRMYPLEGSSIIVFQLSREEVMQISKQIVSGLLSPHQLVNVDLDEVLFQAFDDRGMAAVGRASLCAYSVPKRQLPNEICFPPFFEDPRIRTIWDEAVYGEAMSLTSCYYFRESEWRYLCQRAGREWPPVGFTAYWVTEATLWRLRRQYPLMEPLQEVERLDTFLVEGGSEAKDSVSVGMAVDGIDSEVAKGGASPKKTEGPYLQPEDEIYATESDVGSTAAVNGEEGSMADFLEELPPPDGPIEEKPCDIKEDVLPDRFHTFEGEKASDKDTSLIPGVEALPPQHPQSQPNKLELDSIEGNDGMPPDYTPLTKVFNPLMQLNWFLGRSSATLFLEVREENTEWPPFGRHFDEAYVQRWDRVKKMPTDVKVIPIIKNYDTYAMLKEKIAKAFGIPVENQILMFKPREGAVPKIPVDSEYICSAITQTWRRRLVPFEKSKHRLLVEDTRHSDIPIDLDKRLYDEDGLENGFSEVSAESLSAAIQFYRERAAYVSVDYTSRIGCMRCESFPLDASVIVDGNMTWREFRVVLAETLGVRSDHLYWVFVHRRPYMSHTEESELTEDTLDHLIKGSKSPRFNGSIDRKIQLRLYFGQLCPSQRYKRFEVRFFYPPSHLPIVYRCLEGRSGHLSSEALSDDPNEGQKEVVCLTDGSGEVSHLGGTPFPTLLEGAIRLHPSTETQSRKVSSYTSCTNPSSSSSYVAADTNKAGSVFSAETALVNTYLSVKRSHEEDVAFLIRYGSGYIQADYGGVGVLLEANSDILVWKLKAKILETLQLLESFQSSASIVPCDTSIDCVETHSASPLTDALLEEAASVAPLKPVQIRDILCNMTLRFSSWMQVTTEDFILHGDSVLTLLEDATHKLGYPYWDDELISIPPNASLSSLQNGFSVCLNILPESIPRTLLDTKPSVAFVRAWDPTQWRLSAAQLVYFHDLFHTDPEGPLELEAYLNSLFGMNSPLLCHFTLTSSFPDYSSLDRIDWKPIKGGLLSNLRIYSLYSRKKEKCSVPFILIRSTDKPRKLQEKELEYFSMISKTLATLENGRSAEAAEMDNANNRRSLINRRSGFGREKALKIEVKMKRNREQEVSHSSADISGCESANISGSTTPTCN